MVVQLIRCSEIRPDEYRERETLAPLDELVHSIQHCGVLRPVLLRASAGGYVIVHGERRWRAACLAGLDVIPAFLVQDHALEGHAAGEPVERGLDVF